MRPQATIPGSVNDQYFFDFMLLQGIRQFFTTVQNLRFPVGEKGKGGTKDPLVCPTADMLY